MNKGVTEGDLYKLKAEITKEQQEARHGQNNNIQLALTKSDEVNTENKLLKQSLNNMSEKIEQVQKEMKEGFEKVVTLIKEERIEIEKEYVKVSEFIEFKNMVKSHSKIFWAVFSISISVIFTAIYKLIIK